MKNKIANIFIFLLVLIVPITFAACSGAEKNAVIISNLTQAGQDNYTISFVLGEESILNEKHVDLLICASVDNFTFKIKKEGEEDKTFILTHKDTWYSYTEILEAQSQDSFSQDYELYPDYQSVNYIITPLNNASMKFKMIAGDKFVEITNTRYALRNTYDISDVFKLDVKASAE